MPGKKKINLIKSLAQKKARQKEQLFLVEGDKNVTEVLRSGLPLKEMFATEGFIEENRQFVTSTHNFTVVSDDEIKKASLLKSPQRSIALCVLPPELPMPDKLPDVCFYLDGIQDPGNLGTIIRICDWFGMDYLFCSPDTADIYNPKVIQASMGSFCRIRTIYIAFEEVLKHTVQAQTDIYGAFMDGMNLYTAELPLKAMIVMGNEGNGIRPDISEKIKNRLAIPPFRAGSQGAESLNVAVAAGIIGSEFLRRTL